MSDNKTGRQRAFESWLRMVKSCDKPSNKKFTNYGGRGITYKESWKEFPAFYEDMGDRPYMSILKRFDENGDYNPDNCGWQLHKESKADFHRRCR